MLNLFLAPQLESLVYCAKEMHNLSQIDKASPSRADIRFPHQRYLFFSFSRAMPSCHRKSAEHEIRGSFAILRGKERVARILHLLFRQLQHPDRASFDPEEKLLFICSSRLIG